jgi:DNA mismatch repair protein MutS2
LEELLTEIESTRQELAKAHQPLKQITNIRKSAETIHTLVKAPVDKKRHTTGIPATPTAVSYKIGDKVFITSLQMRAVVTEVGADDVEVQFGSLRARTQLADIQKEDSGDKGKPGDPAKSKSSRTRVATRPIVFRESPGLELNIRGERVDDATSLVERYLEHAYMAGLPFARIVHGKGTGTLRQVVQDLLKTSSYVDGWEIASEKEGGAGVTIVKFKSE